MLLVVVTFSPWLFGTCREARDAPSYSLRVFGSWRPLVSLGGDGKDVTLMLDASASCKSVSTGRNCSDVALLVGSHGGNQVSLEVDLVSGAHGSMEFPPGRASPATRPGC